MKSDVEFDPSPQTVLFDSCKPGEAGSGVSHRRRHPHYPTALYKHKSSLLTRYRELVNIQLTYGRVYECHLWGIWGAISRSKRLFLTMQRERCFIDEAVTAVWLLRGGWMFDRALEKCYLICSHDGPQWDCTTLCPCPLFFSPSSVSGWWQLLAARI